MKYFLLIGRILYSAIFILSSFNHFNGQTIAYAAQQGVFMPSVLVPLSGIISLLGGLSILLGYKAKYGAWLIVIFLVPITFMMHQYWAVKDSMMAMMQLAMFMKNLAMIGAALIIAYFGSGPFSISRK